MADEDRPLLSSSQPQIVLSKWTERVYQGIWVLTLACCAGSISYWIPTLSVFHINLSSFMQNVVGATVISFATSFQQIKFQYYQTYLMYAAVKSGFCSVFTTFGNLIEDTETLLYNGYGWESPVNLLGTLIVAFVMYNIGRLVAMRIKRGALFSAAMQRLVNADRRMQHELDMQLSQADVQDRLSSLRLRTPTNTPPHLPPLRQKLTASRHRSQQQMPSPASRGAALASASPSETVVSMGDGEPAQPLHTIGAFSINDEAEAAAVGSFESERLLGARSATRNSGKYNSVSTVEAISGAVVAAAAARTASTGAGAVPSPADSSPDISLHSTIAPTSLPDLDEHLRYQMVKHKRHTSPYLQRRHVFILLGLWIPTVASIVAVSVLYYQTPDNATMPVDYAVTVVWGVLGAVIGGLIGDNGTHKTDVQWGTFRCNILSCILIGVAHNLLLFRRYFPFAQGSLFPLVVSRFITAYCGSQSSFAGLIDETSSLYHSRVPKKTVVRNLAYNLFVGLVIFLIVVFSVRILFFFR